MPDPKPSAWHRVARAHLAVSSFEVPQKCLRLATGVSRAGAPPCARRVPPLPGLCAAAASHVALGSAGRRGGVC